MTNRTLVFFRYLLNSNSPSNFKFKDKIKFIAVTFFTAKLARSAQRKIMMSVNKRDNFCPGRGLNSGSFCLLTIIFSRYTSEPQPQKLTPGIGTDIKLEPLSMATSVVLAFYMPNMPIRQ
jgi:hypothetical protein